ncbi:PqqD family protein [Humibacter ginsenosidimutans]|uniref:PqqD family protein n=1 Tax=Humibacter ginsenosidimutans TaxID=2599293 RepID=A0A5B8M461_9MICO|nr:PqqD family protein [Humibacter ginsenosidimutans]QDZ14981.1 PqqD family protein [Humibacter ginsenosidimutans]
MTVRYAIRNDLAWIDALDGGRRERTAWVADLATGETFVLNDTAWLIWVLLADGASTVDELRAAADAEGAQDAFDGVEVSEFLDILTRRGLLAVQDEGTATA